MERASCVISIIGHKGRMGNLFFERLQEKGYAVNGIDLPLIEEDLAATLVASSMVILCVPTAVMEEVCQKISSFLLQGTLLMDIASIKVPPMTSMERYYDGPVLGTHPLFGPTSVGFCSISLCLGSWFKKHPQEEKIYLEKAVHLFESLGYEVFYSTAEKHDRMMATIQGLNFVTSVAYFAMLGNEEDSELFMTPSLKRHMESVKNMLEEDGELFTGIFEQNPYSQDAVRRYTSFLSVAAGGDLEILLALAQKYLK